MIFTRNSYPEIISLHIPKTAGTSFRNILKSIYGEDQVVWLDMETNGVIRLNEKIYKEKKLPNVKVVHGHFVYESLLKNFTLPDKYKLITWVRDPVKRVISNFYYLETRLKELLDEERNNLNIISKLQRTLIEYARAEINRNRQVKFLSGSKLEDYDFVGIYEFYESEITRLSTILKLEIVPEIIHHNKTPERNSQLSDDLLNEIRELNKEDVLLYEQALKIRQDKLKE